MTPEIKRTLLGKLKLLAVFKKDIVGGKVTLGKIARGSVVDILRGANKIGVAKITQLQHNKEDVTEVKEGLEGGIKFEPVSGQPFGEIQVGDILEMYEELKARRTL